MWVEARSTSKTEKVLVAKNGVRFPGRVSVKLGTASHFAKKADVYPYGERGRSYSDMIAR